MISFGYTNKRVNGRVADDTSLENWTRETGRGFESYLTRQYIVIGVVMNKSPEVLIKLSERDSKALVNALQAAPKEPTPAFKRALAARKQIERAA